MPPQYDGCYESCGDAMMNGIDTVLGAFSRAVLAVGVLAGRRARRRWLWRERYHPRGGLSQGGAWLRRGQSFIFFLCVGSWTFEMFPC